MQTLVWLVPLFAVVISALLTFGAGRLRRDTILAHARMRTLEEEVSWLRCYADVLRARHGKGLRFNWAITPAASRVLFPRYVLQPLLEEAVMHGLAKGAVDNEISVRAALAGDRGHPKTLVCTVEDAVPVSKPGVLNAVGTLQQMLSLQCKNAKLRVEADGEGTRSTISMPDPSLSEA